MIVLSSYRGTDVGVFGLGKAGEATVAALLAGGAAVYAWDDSEASREALRRKHSRACLLPVAQWPWRALRCMVLGPGVPLTHPAVHLARKAECPIIGDIELLFQACPQATYVAVTGTNGKSTTTTLIAHILKQADRQPEAGGNLGTPALALEPLGAGGVYVLELSSYQLDLVRSTRFHVAVLLNITPDHLDRHGSMEGYAAAKMHIFDRQEAGDCAVIAAEDDHTRRIADLLERRENGPRVMRVQAASTLHTVDLTQVPTLTGRHNWQNAAAACVAARALGVDESIIAHALETFQGLAHRMELVATVENVRFINDSKATNADATANALAPYDAIYWIAGGRSKAGGIEPLAPYFPRIRHAFLIGEAEELFARTLEGKVPFTRCGTLENAVRQAAHHSLAEALPGAVLLLSPACASFDQFRNFEERGDCFRNLVNGGGWRVNSEQSTSHHSPSTIHPPPVRHAS